MIVVEINYLDEDNVACVALFCNGRAFATLPTDTPANVQCKPYLANAGSFQRDMFSGATVGGPVRAGHGTLELSNTNGQLSAWAGYAVDGQAVTIRIGDEGAAYPSGFTTVVTGVRMDRMEMDRRVLRIFLRDRLADFDKPISTSTYLGTGGLEGMSNRVGRRRPKGYGQVFNASPVLLDPSLLLYQMSSSYETSTLDQSVRDGGLSIYNEPAYTSLSDLLYGDFPSSGYVKHYAPAGCFRLGASTVFDVTADRKFHDSATSQTSKLMERMALDAGISAGDIDTVTAMGLNSGFYSEEGDATFLQAMQAISEGAGLWFGWSRLGKLQIGQLTDPASGTSVATYLRHQLKELSRSAPPGMEAPIQRVRMKYQKNWHPLSTVAGAVSTASKEFFGRDWSVLEAADSTIATRHPYAKDLERESYHTDLWFYSAPVAEADRVLTLFKADRAVVRASLDLTPANAAAVDLGSVVTLQTSDFGLSAGKKFVVVSHKIDMQTRRIQLSLWG